MNLLARIAAVLLLLTPLFANGCVDVVDPDVRDDESTESVEAQSPIEDDDSNDEPSQRSDGDLFDEAFGALDDDPVFTERMQSESRQPVDDDDSTDSDGHSGNDTDADRQDDDFVAADGLSSTMNLHVDDDAPELEIRHVDVDEGQESHFIEVMCHDPEVSRTRWHRSVRSRFSRRCEIDLATAARAIELEPAVDVRIAPTPTGFRIMGDFEQGEYELSLAAGLRSQKGSYLHEDDDHTLDVPLMSQSLSFEASGLYLPQRGWEKLGFHHRNVDEVDVVVRHVPADNLPFWISDDEDDVDQRTSRRVVDTSISVPDEPDEMLRSDLAIDNHLGESQAGLYQIELESGDASATSRLQVTDLNLITKRHEAAPDRAWEQAIDVWAVDMETTEPTGGVQVHAIQPNGSRMADCRTDADGHCRLDLPEADIDTTPPIAVLAEHGSDLTYLKFDDVRIETGVDAADGPAYLEEHSYLAALYGDRDLYRPGDEAHLFGALRDDDYSAAASNIPAEVTVTDPEGNVVVEDTVQTNSTGTFDLSFLLDDIAPTGRWRAQMEVGGRTLETYSFHVEEFVPERLEVNVDPTQPTFTASDEASFEIEAQYLFGASAEGSQVDLECRLVPVDSPRGSDGDDWSYGPIEIEDSRDIFDLPSRDDVIGSDDTVEMACPRPDTTPSGPMRVEANVAVAEGGSGRTTHGAADALMHPSPVEIGLRADADELESGDTLTVEGRLDELEGYGLDEVADGPVTLEFYNVRRQRSWRWRRRGSRVHDDYQLILERAVDAEVEDGTFTARTAVADVHTAYLVRARFGDTTTDLKIDRRGRGWRWTAQRDTTPQPRRPSEVTVETPAQASVEGQTPVKFTAPFDGRALLTVETDEVTEQSWMEVSEGQQRWAFGVDGDEPNVYVSVFIIRDPGDAAQGAFTPERAFGSVSLPVEPAGIDAGVGIDAPDEVRPGDTLTVEVDTSAVGDDATATIAAVDEGILSLTNYQTPDPLTTLWTERSPGVETFDTVGWATRLPTLNPTSRTGGGGKSADEQAAQDRILPFEPVALWSGPVDVGADGRATVEFDIPNYRGRLRVMSAVFGQHRMGADATDVAVRDPLTVQTTFPRHMADEDEAKIPVFLTNLTEHTQSIDVSIDAEPIDPVDVAATVDDDDPVLAFDEGRTQSVELDADESTTLYFSARATRPGGGAEVVVQAESSEHHSVDEGTIPLRPRGPTERQVDTVELEDGVVDLSDRLDGWVPASEETTIFASAMQQPEAFDDLDELVRYPHGCAEQTLSRARPLVFLPELVEGIDPQLASEHGDLRNKVDAGINRILSMQTSSGGVQYWPRGGRVHTWVTANTLHFLMDADDRGYHVPQSRIDDAIDWLSDNVDSSASDAYEHYVLALAGDAQTSKIREAIDDLPSSPSGRSREHQYLLQAALYLAGDRSYADELRNPEVDDDPGGRRTGWGFYSHRRQRAMILNVFIELFGTDSSAEPLVEKVTDDLTNSTRPTTQESVWAVMALGSWHSTDGLEDVDVALHAGGQTVSAQNGGANFKGWAVHRASEFDEIRLEIEKNGFDGDLSALVRSQGVRQKPTEEAGGQDLGVRRRYRNRDGEHIDGDDISPGDVVYVELRLTNERPRSVHNLALTDRLPAGLEVENPDLGAAELPEWANDDWDYDHVDIRDDRVDIYGGLSSREITTAVIATRATISGDFHAPGTFVEAMYDPDIWARSEADDIHIGAPAQELID